MAWGGAAGRYYLAKTLKVPLPKPRNGPRNRILYIPPPPHHLQSGTMRNCSLSPKGHLKFPAGSLLVTPLHHTFFHTHNACPLCLLLVQSPAPERVDAVSPPPPSPPPYIPYFIVSALLSIMFNPPLPICCSDGSRQGIRLQRAYLRERVAAWGLYITVCPLPGHPPRPVREVWVLTGGGGGGGRGDAHPDSWSRTLGQKMGSA